MLQVLQVQSFEWVKSVKSGFHFMLKKLIGRISDKKLILEISTKRFQQNFFKHIQTQSYTQMSHSMSKKWFRNSRIR